VIYARNIRLIYKRRRRETEELAADSNKDQPTSVAP